MRKVIIALALVLGFTSASHAVTAMCTGGFRGCDPTSGTCYTAWDVKLAGQSQAQCSADPSSCFRSALAFPTTITAPTNPLAMRICPAGAACEDTPNPWPSRGSQFNQMTNARWQSWMPPAGAGWQRTCWQFTCPGGVCHPIQQLPIEGCILHDCWAAGGCTNFYDFYGEVSGVTFLEFPYTYQPTSAFHPDGSPVIYPWLPWDAGLVYEKPNYNPAIPWVMAPGAGAQRCDLPASNLTMAMKVIELTQGTKTTSDEVQKYHDKTLDKVAKQNQNIKDGLYGNRFGNWAKIEKIWLTTLIYELSLAIQALNDPPNSAYQSVPPLPTLTPFETMVADSTITQAQATAFNAWGAAYLPLAAKWDQLFDIYDSLAGAMNASDAAWVRKLALAAENVAADIGTLYPAEVAARAAFVASFPSHPPLHAGCSTPTDILEGLRSQAAFGVRLYGGFLSHEEQKDSPCGTVDESFASAMSSMPSIIVDSFALPGFRSRICATTGYCSSKMTLTSDVHGHTNSYGIGKLKGMITVTTQPGDPYPVAEPVTVTVHGAGIFYSIIEFLGGIQVPDQTLVQVDANTWQVMLNVAVPVGANYDVVISYPGLPSGKKSPSSWSGQIFVCADPAACP